MQKRKSRKKSVRTRKIPHIFYERWKKALKGIYRFSFRASKRFTRGQKMVIRRAYNRYEFIVSGLLSGDLTIIRLPRRQLATLRDRYTVTNMVVVVYSRADRVVVIKKPHSKTLKKFRTLNKRPPEKYLIEDITDDEADRLLRLDALREWFGDFNNRTLIYERGKVREQIFIPLMVGEKLDDLIDYVWWYFNPTHVLFSVGKSQSTQSYTENEWENYRETLMLIDKKIRNSYLDKDEQEKTPFNGVYAVWYSALQTRTNKIKG